jgi:uncharacterized protein
MPDHDTSSRPSLGVVGSGVSGLTAAYLLQRRYDVTLYETDSRLGGHAHTHDLVDADGRPQSVDTGFIVHNRRTYPNLLRLFAELGVQTQESEMSMSISCTGCGLEYAGARGLGGLFARPANLRNPRFLRMLAEVKKFHRQAAHVLADPSDHRTFGQFLDDGGYSTFFNAHFAIPVVSCVWSCGNAEARQYPARYLFRFLEHHGMLAVTGSPSWRTVTGGSQSYVARAAKQLTAVLTGTGVREIRRHHDGVEIRTGDDDLRRHDHVVVATHPDQALRLLADPTDDEARTLGAFGYSTATTLLHSDVSVLPTAPRAHASWNYRMSSCTGTEDRVNVTYDMNRLQRLPDATRYLVTLNSPELVDPASVLDRMTYQHPIYTPESVAAQADLPALNSSTTAYAGAYHGWGFHEDGCASGVRAAAAFGVDW